jgi:release factor glutamine methyltransferase
MQNRIKIADICSGAGNLGLALATHIPSAVVLETDLSKDAVALTDENILFLGLTQRVKAIPGDLFEACNSDNDFASDIDLIVCNPPYISSGKVPKMKAEISENEPVLAFDGGMLGTRIILRLISESPVFLKSGGWLCFEVGLGQGDFAAQLCERSGHYQKIETAVDSKGNVRSIAAQRK